MSLNSYAENINNAPYGLQNTNAPGSPYAVAYSRGVTNHLSLPVDPIIFDAQPQQFLDLQFLMAFASSEVAGDEVIWQENVWSRSPITLAANFTVVAASPGVTVTGTITYAAASESFIYPGQKLHYTATNGTQVQCVVDSVNTGANTAVIRSMVGVGLAAVASGANFTDGRTLGGDGQSTFVQPVRTQTVQRTNLLEKIGPEQTLWNHLERIKWKNLQQTNFMETDMKNLLTQLKVTMCQRIWFGQYGETLTLGGAIAKTTEGIVPAIQNNGGATIQSTMSTVWDDLTTGIFQTNFGPNNNQRVVFGTPEMLHALNLKQKAEFIRYSSGDKVFDLDFEVWKIGGQTLTLVPVQIWGDIASFPEIFSRRLVVLQQNTVKLVTMRGVPMIQQGVKVSQSRNNITPFEIYDFERYTVEGFIGVQMQGAAFSFVIDVQ